MQSTPFQNMYMGARSLVLDSHAPHYTAVAAAIISLSGFAYPYVTQNMVREPAPSGYVREEKLYENLIERTVADVEPLDVTLAGLSLCLVGLITARHQERSSQRKEE